MSDDIAIPVPPEYDDAEAEAYRTGFYTCAQLFSQAAGTYMNAVDLPGEDDDTDDDVDTCPECGAEMRTDLGVSKCLECDV